MARKTKEPLINEASYFEFLDSNAADGLVCSINAGPKGTGLWLGIETKKRNGRAMFLRDDGVARLVARLQAWLDTGSLTIDRERGGP